MHRISLALLTGLILGVGVVVAQDCPALLEAALLACNLAAPGEACYGSVPAVQIGEDGPFAAPGDTVLLRDTRAIATAPDAGVVVMLAQPDADTLLQFVLLGDAVVEFETLQPLPALILQSGPDTGCGSGLFIDAPDEVTLRAVRVNDVTVLTTGAVFVSATPGEALQVTPLVRPVEVVGDDFEQVVAQGDALSVPLDEEMAFNGAPELIRDVQPPAAFVLPQATLQVTSAQANVRFGDSTAYRVITTVREGDTLEVLAVSATGSGWLKVRVPDGREGWLSPVTFAFDGDTDALPAEIPPPPPPDAPQQVVQPADDPAAAPLQDVNTAATQVAQTPQLVQATVEAPIPPTLLTNPPPNAAVATFPVELATTVVPPMVVTFATPLAQIDPQIQEQEQIDPSLLEPLVVPTLEILEFVPILIPTPTP